MTQELYTYLPQIYKLMIPFILALQVLNPDTNQLLMDEITSICILYSISLTINVITSNTPRSQLVNMFKESYKKTVRGVYFLRNKNLYFLNNLLLTADNKNYTLIKFFLKKMGAGINQADSFGRTTLFIAARNGNIGLLKSLLKKGGNINQPCHNGVSPLSAAVSQNQTEVVKFLLDNDAHINQTDNKGRSPIWLAARNGHAEITQICLNKGANIGIEVTKITLVPRSAREVAKLNGNDKVTKMIDHHQEKIQKVMGAMETFAQSFSTNSSRHRAAELATLCLKITSNKGYAFSFHSLLTLQKSFDIAVNKYCSPLSDLEKIKLLEALEQIINTCKIFRMNVFACHMHTHTLLNEDDLKEDTPLIHKLTLRPEILSKTLSFLPDTQIANLTVPAVIDCAYSPR